MKTADVIKRTCRVLAAVGIAGALLMLLVFANLASGADRIDSGKPRHKIAILASKLASAQTLAAGDRVERIFDLKTAGKARVTLFVAVKQATPLTDPKLGLRVRLDACIRAWRLTADRKRYRCKGKAALVSSEAPALGRHLLEKLRKRGRNHLRLTLTLPSSAPNALEGQSAQLIYRFR
jgi:hypothetical protein